MDQLDAGVRGEGFKLDAELAVVVQEQVLRRLAR
jgi:hypothetical protein